MSFSFDKVKTGTCNFVSILNSKSVGATIAGLLFYASLTIILAKTIFRPS